MRMLKLPDGRIRILIQGFAVPRRQVDANGEYVKAQRHADLGAAGT